MMELLSNLESWQALAALACLPLLGFISSSSKSNSVDSRIGATDEARVTTGSGVAGSLSDSSASVSGSFSNAVRDTGVVASGSSVARDNGILNSGQINTGLQLSGHNSSVTINNSEGVLDLAKLFADKTDGVLKGLGTQLRESIGTIGELAKSRETEGFGLFSKSTLWLVGGLALLWLLISRKN